MLTPGRCFILVLATASLIPGSFSQTSTSTANQADAASQKAQAGAPPPDKKTKPKQPAAAKGGAKTRTDTPPAATQNQNEPQSGWLSVPGDFRPIRNEIADLQKKNPSAPLACQAASAACTMDACGSLLGADGKEVGVVNCLTISSDDKVTLTYTAKYPGAPDPAYLAIGNKKPPDHIYPIPSAKLPVNREEIVSREQVISGDFCQADENCNCTTPFLKPANPWTACTAGQVNAGDWKGRVQASVRASDGEAHGATLMSLSPDAARISFSGPSSFKPAWVDLYTDTYSEPFIYSSAQPVQVRNLNYEADDLERICEPNKDNQPDCTNTDPRHLQIKPLTLGANLEFVVLTDKLLVARVKAPMGLEPANLIVTNTSMSPPKSVVVRRTIKPGQNSRLLRVDMTIMDQLTALRNYGNRIAKRYIAVTLDVKNPTSKKVQFNKSAIYFDVDYKESKERPKGFTDWFLIPIGVGVTLGTYQPSVYTPPFVDSGKDGKPPRVARFGLEQNVRHSPVNYLTALGSFDYTTTITDHKLKVLELLGSVLTTIATGGIVADSSGAFKAGSSVYAGTFLPGVRSIVMDTSAINRLRSNLVAQTLQETVQVAAGSSTSTIVLIPRTGILAFIDAEVPVIVDRVIDVHLDEEVVTPVGETSVKKGECTPGNDKDQIRQALGEPSGVTTDANNTSTFTYSKGPMATVSFNDKGVVQSCKPRSASEQLNQATTMAEATQTLSDLGLSSTKLDLTDGGTILVDIPGVQTVYRFDSKGARQPDYTLLFDDIKAQVGKPKSDFEQYLENKAKPLSPDRSSKIEDEAKTNASGKLSDAVRYESPDLKEGWMQVTFKASGKEKDKAKLDASSVVDKISFQGAKPKNVQ